MTDPADPVADSRAELLATLSPKMASVLDAKLKLIALERDDTADAGYRRITRAHAAKGQLASSITLEAFWKEVTVFGDGAAESAIQDCMNVGISDDNLISRFVGADLENFLNAFMVSHTRSLGFKLSDVIRYRDMASQVASRIPSKVTSARFEFEKVQPTTLTRLLSKFTSHPGIAWTLLLYMIVTSLLGTASVITSILQFFTPK